MKDIQDWLGHSSYATTANIYAHLDTDSKKQPATKMNQTVSITPGISAAIQAGGENSGRELGERTGERTGLQKENTQVFNS